jgi:hypothetical protein
MLESIGKGNLWWVIVVDYMAKTNNQQLNKATFKTSTTPKS